MRKSLHIVLAGVVLLAAAALGGCSSDGPLTNDNPAGNDGAYSNPSVTYAGDQSCSAAPDQVNKFPTSGGTGITVADLGGSGNHVIGSVWITCSPSPVSQTTDVELWYAATTGGGYTLVSKTASKIIPSEDPTWFSAATECEPGLYQVRWSIVGEDDTDSPMSYSDTWATGQVTAHGCAEVGANPSPNQTGDGPVVLD